MTGVELLFFLIGGLVTMIAVIFGLFVCVAYSRRRRDRTHASLFARARVIWRTCWRENTEEMEREIDEVLEGR